MVAPQEVGVAALASALKKLKSSFHEKKCKNDTEDFTWWERFVHSSLTFIPQLALLVAELLLIDSIIDYFFMLFIISFYIKILPRTYKLPQIHQLSEFIHFDVAYYLILQPLKTV